MRQQRYGYLRERGFMFDPFDDPVAEHEMFSRAKDSRFLSYFVACDVLHTSAGRSVLTPDFAKNTVIYGAGGSGRTALGFAWEVSHRVARSQLLLVTHVLHNPGQPTRLEAQSQQFLESLATNLFIQIVEQFNPQLQPITDDMIAALRATIASGSLRLRDTIRRLLDELSTHSIADLSVCWRWLGRPSVRAVPVSESLAQLIRSCARTPETAPLAPVDAFRAGVAAARAWGYGRVVVVVDLGTHIEHTSGDTLSWLRSLPQLISAYRDLDVTFQIFVPLSARAILRPAFRALEDRAALDELFIVWSEDQLGAVLAQRFHAAGMRSDGLYALADDALAPYLDPLILMAAAQSPRRLLQVVRALLDLHVASDVRSGPIGMHEWRQLCNHWPDHDHSLPGLDTVLEVHS